MDDLVSSVNSCNQVVKALEKHNSYSGDFG